MAATLKEFVIKGCSIFIDHATDSNKNKFAIIGSMFSTLDGFKASSISLFNSFKTVEGKRCFPPLTQKEKDALSQLQSIINPDVSIEENFIILLTGDFIRKQKLAIENITIDTLNANPLLCKALQLNSPEDFVRFYTYSALSRSIVTSMGFLVQNLLLYSNDNVYDGKDYDTSYSTKWDVVIEGLDGVKRYIEVKSGPNDLDKTQIISYDKAIKKIRDNGEYAYFGITYGKKTGNYVSTNILRTYVNDWEEKTLIGTELWDYISENGNYHNVLMNTIESIAEAVIGERRIVEMIEDKISLLIEDFNRNYSSMEDFCNSLW